jgi:hypothetical protein
MDTKKVTTLTIAIFSLLIVVLHAPKEDSSVKVLAAGKGEKIEDILIGLKDRKEIPPPKPAFTETGKATYYDYKVTGKKRELTAAHKYLPRGTILKVEAIGPEAGTYQTIEVEVNDRLPNILANEGTVIDLTKKAAIAMNPKFVSRGKISVRLTEIKQ